MQQIQGCNRDSRCQRRDRFLAKKFLVHFSPAAIDLENRDLASLVVPKLRFAQMATIKEDEIKYKLVIKVSEKRGVLQLGY